MAPMKRKAGFAKRSAKRSRTDKRVPTVVNALAGADVLPANFRALLKGALPVALNAYKADRHEYEKEVINQAQGALKQVQAAIEAKHKESVAKQAEMISDKELKRRQKGKQDAEARAAAAKAKLENDKVSKKAAEKGVQEAEAALKAAKQEQRVAESDFSKLTNKKAGVEATLATEFAMLKDGTSGSAAGRKAVDKLRAVGKEYGMDSTLLATLPAASKKPAVMRTEFENQVFTGLEALINTQIASLGQQVGAAEPGKNAKVAAAAAAQGALDQAKAALKQAEETLDAAHTATKEANKEVTKADHVLRHIWEDMRHSCDAQDSLLKEKNDFMESVWGAFNALKEKEPEPEPVAEPVVEAAAAEAPAAEAPAAADAS